MKRKLIRKPLALLLALIMLFSLLPTAALAEGSEQELPLKLTLKVNTGDAEADFSASGMNASDDGYVREWAVGASVSQTIYITDYDITHYSFKGWSINGADPLLTGGSDLFTPYGIIPNADSTTGIIDTTTASRPYTGGTLRINNSTVAASKQDITILAVFERRAADPELFKLEKDSVTIGKGGTADIKVDLHPDLSAGASLSAGIANQGVASGSIVQNDDGSKYMRIKGVAAGSTEARAKLGSKYSSAPVAVNVLDPSFGGISELFMSSSDTKDLTLSVLYPSSYTEMPEAAWESSEPGVVAIETAPAVPGSASFTQKATLTAKGVGTATVTATVQGVSVSCSVMVTDITGITLPETMSASKGSGTLDLTAVIAGSGDAPVAWSSDNVAVASVSETTGETNTLKLNHGGTAVITATVATSDGPVAAECKVSVTGDTPQTDIPFVFSYNHYSYYDGWSIAVPREDYTADAGFAISKGHNSNYLGVYSGSATVYDAVMTVAEARLSNNATAIEADGTLKGLYQISYFDPNYTVGVVLNGVLVNRDRLDRILLEPKDEITVFMLRTKTQYQKLTLEYESAWFENQAGERMPTTVTVSKGDTISLKLHAVALGGAVQNLAGMPQEGIQLGIFDLSTKKFTPLSGDGSVVTGTDGAVSYVCSQAGSFTLAAIKRENIDSSDYSLYVPPAMLTVIVEDNSSADFISLNGVNGSSDDAAKRLFTNVDGSRVYTAQGQDGISGGVAPGAKVKIDGAAVDVDKYGNFKHKYECADNYTRAFYQLHRLQVTSPDGSTSKDYTLLIQPGNNIFTNLELPFDYLLNSKGETLPRGFDYSSYLSGDTVYDGETEFAFKQIVSSPVINTVAVVDSLDKAYVKGTRQENTPLLTEVRTRKLNSDGSLGDYITGSVEGDYRTYTTGLLEFDPGVNLFLTESKISGYDGWLQYGVRVVYRMQNEVAKDIAMSPADVSVTDAFGTVFTPQDTGRTSPVNGVDCPIWSVTVPAGSDSVDQAAVKARILKAPGESELAVYYYQSGSSGSSSSATLLEDGSYEIPLPSTAAPTSVYTPSTKTMYLSVKAPNGISAVHYLIEINREAKAPTAETAGLLYKLQGAQPYDASGKAMDIKSASSLGFGLRTARGASTKTLPSGYDFTASSAQNEFYLTYRGPDTSADQKQIAQVAFSIAPLCILSGATATCRTVDNEGKTITEHSVTPKAMQGALSYFYVVVPHSGGYTEVEGSNTYEYTKAVVTVVPPQGIEGAQSRDYTFKIPKIAATDVQLSKITVKAARTEDQDGRQLYTHGSGFEDSGKTTFSADTDTYDVKVDYNTEHIYIEPVVLSPGIAADWKLDGNPVTATDSILLNGLDGVVPLQVGENKLQITYSLKDGGDAKTYTFYITRGTNCNAALSYSDNVEVMSSTKAEHLTDKTIIYERSQNVFDITVTPRELSRKVTIKQDGSVKAEGAGAVQAKGLSLYAKAEVAVADTDTGDVKSYTVNPYPYAQDAPTSTYAVMPAPGQFLNGAWSGFDNVRVVGAIGEPSEENMGGSGGGSLGTFGGYVIYYYADSIQNGAKNKYGGDFLIKGNAFPGNNEPAAVKVAQDKDKDGKPDKDESGNEIWYDLAGSLHYDDSTIWDYEATYTNPNPDFMPYVAQDVPYTDNQGNSGTGVYANSYHGQPYYPDGRTYDYEGNNAEYDGRQLTFSGVLLDAVNLGGRSIPARFGYAECAPGLDESGVTPVAYNPYRKNPATFDIDWAVDKNGNPVHLDEINFVWIYSATMYDKDATGELSPEITGINRLDKLGTSEVGRTPKPTNITLKSAGFSDLVISSSELPESGGVLEYSVGARQFVQAVVNGDLADTMFVNNDRVSSGTTKASFVKVVNDSERLVRVIVQRGEMEPYIVLLRLTGTAEDVDTTLYNVQVMRNGTPISNVSKTGAYTYELTVPSNYSILQIVPKAKAGAQVTVNGNELNDDGYADVALNEAGETTVVTIKTVFNGKEEESTLTVTREAGSGGPETGAATISIEKFTLGQGYLVEPVQVTFNKGDTAADVTKALLTELYGAEAYIGNNSEYSFYLAHIYDPNRGGLNIPSFITDALTSDGTALNTEDSDPDYLGEYDYTSTSGWMITVNNLFIPVSSGAWELEDGDVIRWQFTLYGLGADVGNSSPDSSYGGRDSIIPATDKDALTERVAEINGRADKDELLQIGGNQEKYDQAIAVLNNLLSEQEAIDQALTALNNLEGIATSTTLTPEVEASDGTAAAKMTEADMEGAIEAVKKEGGDITVKPQISGEADQVTVELPKTSLSSMATETEAGLRVETPVGIVSIPHETLASIAAQAEGDSVTVSLESVDKEKTLSEAQKKAVGDKPVFDITIKSGDKEIGSFNGGCVTISLPYTLKDGETADEVKVWYLNDAGELEEIACTYDPETGLATFTTDHLSYYTVGTDKSENEDAVEAKKVDDLIAKISDPVTLADKEAIEKARAAYNALTERQKNLVTKLQQLKAAEKALSDLQAVKAVEDKITAIGTVTLESKSTIDAARKAYNALSTEQAKLVSNYQTLTAAEAAYAALLADKDNAEAAKKVDDLIAVIGTVTLESKSAIEAARAAFDTLTPAQAKLVSNYQTLVAAEKAYEALVKQEPGPTPSPGDGQNKPPADDKQVKTVPATGDLNSALLAMLLLIALCAGGYLYCRRGKEENSL